MERIRTSSDETTGGMHMGKKRHFDKARKIFSAVRKKRKNSNHSKKHKKRGKIFFHKS